MAITNVKRLMGKLNKLGGDSGTVFERAVEQMGKQIERYAKDYCPESGINDDSLRDSIHFEILKKDGVKTTGRVVTNAEYAAYVEFGTGPVGEKNGGVASELASKITYKSEGWYIPAHAIEPEVAERYDLEPIHMKGGRKVKKGFFSTTTTTYEEADFYYSEGQPAQPYMYPAVSGKEEVLTKIANTEIKKEINKICNG